jgi:hypothetical protein
MAKQVLKNSNDFSKSTLGLAKFAELDSIILQKGLFCV